MSKENDFLKIITNAYHLVLYVFILVIIAGGLFAYAVVDPNFSAFKNAPETATNISIEEDFNTIENGIHVRTGLIDAEGLVTVVNNCTTCHSAKLIMQNRMSAARWNSTIKWMQETQNLGDLGTNQEVIVNYLVANYPPKEVGRRENLTNIDWYELKSSKN